MKILNVCWMALLFTASSCVAYGPDPDSAENAPVIPAVKDSNVHVAFQDKTSPTQESADVYKVKLETSKGDIVIEVHPEWSPNGAAQFKEAIKDGVYDDARFFRVVKNFMVQFGIPGDPPKATKWRNKNIKDDPPKKSNARGMVTYAKSDAPNSRTTQVFINFKDNAFLDRDGFAPFGQVVDGMNVVDSLYNEYGEGAPSGRGPDQTRVQAEGNAYLNANFPKLDYIKKATIIEPAH